MKPVHVIPFEDLEFFYSDTCEDVNLWDEADQGPYPPNRFIEALKNFMESKTVNASDVIEKKLPVDELAMNYYNLWYVDTGENDEKSAAIDGFKEGYKQGLKDGPTPDNQEILEKLYNNTKTIVAYYMYPTGSNTNHIIKTDNWNRNKYDVQLKNFVNLIVQLGAAAAGMINDNKTGVEVHVDGIDFPIFCYKHDGMFAVTKGLKQRDGRDPIKIHWRIGN